MNNLEVIKHCVSNSALLIREKKTEHIKGEPWQYDIKELSTGKKKGWIMLDSFTASAMLQVYNAMNSEQQSKYNTFHFLKLVDFTWKVLKK